MPTLSPVHKALEAKGFNIIVIDLGSADSALDLFLQIMTELPTDPSYDHKVLNRDASDDCLWGGLICVAKDYKHGWRKKVKVFAFGEGENFATLSIRYDVAMIE